MRVPELLREDEDCRRFELRLEIRWHEIGGPDVMADRTAKIAVFRQSFCQLESGFSKAWILLNGVLVLNDGLVELAGCDVLVTALEEFPFCDLGILSAPRYQQRHDGDA